ncbi:hypothetical protein [Streptomyces sp. SID3343]|uniref:hypothetical protein n=1 Tax=Streptomyces sp. SID3343 TaxID=2690260 RepID=UPI0013683AED|nr:hypothetical protein [Streptomyces sp. SID3343]MYV97759.1 hypothetical protein [Streptomyces sp. SID3343]
MKRALFGAFVAVTVATGGMVVTAGTAQARTSPSVAGMTVHTADGQLVAAKLCQPWHDKNTFGVRCNTNRAYYAWAKCKNGQTATGVVTNSNRWSYAYCTSRGSSLDYGKGKWAP